VCQKLIKNSKLYAKKIQKTMEGGVIFLTHTVDSLVKLRYVTASWCYRQCSLSSLLHSISNTAV